MVRERKKGGAVIEVGNDPNCPHEVWLYKVYFDGRVAAVCESCKRIETESTGRDEEE